MPYGQPQSYEVNATYVATFQHVNGTQIQMMFIDPLGMGLTDTTNDDFLSAVDALATSAGWTYQTGHKSYATQEMVSPS